MTGFEIVGTYRQCTTCRAPAVTPYPVDWTIELIKEGPSEGPVTTCVTPHTADCDAPAADPQPGCAVRLRTPGITLLDVTLPPPVTHSPVRTGLWWDHPNMDPEGLRADAREAVRREATRPITPPYLADGSWAVVGHTTGFAITDMVAGQMVTAVDEGEERFFKPVVPYDISGHTVTVDGTMPPDQVAIVSGVDPDELLPGESVADALIRLGRIVVVRDDGDDG